MILRRLVWMVSPLCDSLRLGREHGFDSGVVLEHVYQNRPSGKGRLGTALDRLCLNSVGWQASRARCAKLNDLVRETLGENVRQGLATVLLDVGCGSARYVLDALTEFRGAAVSAVLWDYKTESCEVAASQAEALRVSARIEREDAFSDDALRRLSPRPNVIIAAGLHEVVPDDDLVRRHFHQVYEALEAPGRFIFTVQPYHPQLELVARILPSHTGTPWVMSLRPLDLTMAWARAAGFSDFEVWMHESGITGVVIAEKAAPGEPPSAD
jgi:SAM-dependent methyltransferase